MEVNKKRVADLLSHLDGRVQLLKTLRVGSLSELEKNEERFCALKNILYEAVMDVIKIGQHIIAALQLEKPQTYRDVLRILGENNIVPEELFKRIQRMGGFRVILAHEYESIDRETVYKLHLRTMDFEEFIYNINKFLEKS